MKKDWFWFFLYFFYCRENSITYIVFLVIDWFNDSYINLNKIIKSQKLDKNKKRFIIIIQKQFLYIKIKKTKMNETKKQKRHGRLLTKVKDHKITKKIHHHAKKVKESYQKLHWKLKIIDHQILMFIHEAELSFVLLLAVVVCSSFAGYLLFGGSKDVKDEDVLMKYNVNQTVSDKINETKSADTVWWSTRWTTNSTKSADTVWWSKRSADTVWWSKRSTDTVWWSKRSTDTVWWSKRSTLNDIINSLLNNIF